MMNSHLTYNLLQNLKLAVKLFKTYQNFLTKHKKAIKIELTVKRL